MCYDSFPIFFLKRIHIEIRYKYHKNISKERKFINLFWKHYTRVGLPPMAINDAMMI